jgi:hypothetical protein
MDLHYAIPAAIVAAGSLFLVCAPFLSRFRNASLWLRLCLFFSGPIGITWSGIAFYLLMHEKDGHTLLSWPRFWALDHMKSNIAGLAVGMLICIVLSPEFRSFSRRKRSV